MIDKLSPGLATLPARKTRRHWCYDCQFYICSSVHRNSRLQKSNKMQQYADIYLLLNYSTCFGRPSRPSSGVHKTLVQIVLTGERASSNVTFGIWWGKFCQKHNYKCMVKWWCLLEMEKLHVSAYSGHLQVLTIFLLKEIYIICLNRISLLARKLSKPENGRYRLKYVVSPLLINTII